MAIHPTAVIDSRAILAADVSIGPFTVIEGPVRIESGTIIGPHAHLLGRRRSGRTAGFMRASSSATCRRTGLTRAKRVPVGSGRTPRFANT